MDTFTTNSIFSGESAINSKIESTNLGTIPFSFFFNKIPYIVNVFPDDVYPYANIEPFQPSNTPSITGLATTSNTSSYVQSIENA